MIGGHSFSHKSSTLPAFTALFLFLSAYFRAVLLLLLLRLLLPYNMRTLSLRQNPTYRTAYTTSIGCILQPSYCCLDLHVG